MSNQTILECLKQNVEAFEIIHHFMTFGEGADFRDFMQDFHTDSFEGYEWLVPLLLLSSTDAVVCRAQRRLFLELFHEKLKKIGPRETVASVMTILSEEHARWETRRGRIEQIQKECLL